LKQVLGNRTALSLGITALVLLVTAIADFFLGRPGDRRRPPIHVPGTDLVAKTFLTLFGAREDAAVIGGLGWFALSCTFGLAVPYFAGFGQFITQPLHLINALDWVIAGPALVGAYLYLVKSLNAL
jgi:hypothetical protein